MGHELVPRCGELPSVRDIVRLVRGEFRHVVVDEDDGLKQAHARAQWIEQAPARVFLGRREEALRGAAKLRALSRGDAVTIEFGDERKTSQRVAVLPGGPLSFGYSSTEEEESARPLIERLARVLDCDVVVV